MAKKRTKAKAHKRRSSERLRALMRTQQINALLQRSMIESEALQNVGDDRPVDEGHIMDLLERERTPIVVQHRKVRHKTKPAPKRHAHKKGKSRRR